MMKVKICCISSVDEALMAIRSGATELGLVGPMPSGPGVIPYSTMKEIVEAIPVHINTCLLTSTRSAAKIIESLKKVKTSSIQIVDKLEFGTYQDIRSAIPGIKIIQVIHVLDEQSVLEAQKIASEVDYILLDSGRPDKIKKELGGTGRTHDWALSKKIVETINTPVFLAGGLNSSNIEAAIAIVNPYGVDICSGVRKNGKLDLQLLRLFFSHLQL
jgi:phosphoribosylanthranilate isomerase